MTVIENGDHVPSENVRQVFTAAWALLHRLDGKMKGQTWCRLCGSPEGAIHNRACATRPAEQLREALVRLETVVVTKREGKWPRVRDGVIDPLASELEDFRDAGGDPTRLACAIIDASLEAAEALRAFRPASRKVSGLVQLPNWLTLHLRVLWARCRRRTGSRSG